MGNQPMNMQSNDVRSKIQQQISLLAVPDTSFNARKILALYASDPNIGTITRQMLAAAGWQVANGTIVHSSAGQMPGGGGPAGAPGQWGAALQSMPQPNPKVQGPDQPAAMTDPRLISRAQGNAKGVDPNAPLTSGYDQTVQDFNADRRAGYGTDVNGDGSGDGAAGVAGGQADAGSLASQHPEWANTFFGQAQPGALDALAASPDQAWGMFVGQKNPNGGGNSLYNSTASGYAANDFQSAMKLGGLLGSTSSGPGDTLAFADNWTKSAINGGGQYADPHKILQQALAVASAPENANNEANQRQIISDALSAVEPYMDPTQYQMLMNRVDRIMNDYMVQGVNNGMKDQAGVLLNQIYGAIG